MRHLEETDRKRSVWLALFQRAFGSRLTQTLLLAGTMWVAFDANAPTTRTKPASM